jgi:hypothetical protein
MKRNKVVAIMSTVHEQPDVEDSKERKTLAVLDYNQTKGAIDAFDQMISYYNVCKEDMSLADETVLFLDRCCGTSTPLLLSGCPILCGKTTETSFVVSMQRKLLSILAIGLK